MLTVDEVLAQLAAVPPSEFTRERNALVARLTQAGQAKTAARVHAMPRPTIPVWAVTRLARDEAIASVSSPTQPSGEEANHVLNSG